VITTPELRNILIDLGLPLEKVEAKKNKVKIALVKSYLAVTVDSEVYRTIERLRGREKRSTFVDHLLRLGIREHKRLLEQEPKG